MPILIYIMPTLYIYNPDLHMESLILFLVMKDALLGWPDV